MLKKLASLCIASAMILSAAGCGVVGGNSDTNSSIESVATNQTEKERVIAEAQAYLEENYPDDVFTYYTGKSPDWAYHYYELTFTSQKYDNQYVTVYGSHSSEETSCQDKYNYYDTYFEYSMKDEAEEYFYNIAKDYITDDIVVKIDFVTTIASSQNLDRKSNFIDNYNDGNMGFILYIVTENDIEKNRDMMASFINKFKEEGHKIWVTYAMTNNLYELKDYDIVDILDDYSHYFIKSEEYSTSYSSKNQYQREKYS